MKWEFNDELYDQIDTDIDGCHVAILFPEANNYGKYMPQLYVDDDRDYVDFEPFDTCEEAIDWVMENIEYIKKFVSKNYMLSCDRLIDGVWKHDYLFFCTEEEMREYVSSCEGKGIIIEKMCKLNNLLKVANEYVL